MFPDYLGTEQRTLGSDDIDGLCFLYGECVACEAPDAGTSSAVDGGVGSGSGLLADPCSSGGECRSATCSQEGFCTQACDRVHSCPSRFDCIATGETSECRPVGGAVGAPCSGGSECHSGLCLATNGDGACTRQCATALPCPDGCGCVERDGHHICLPITSGCSATTTPTSSHGGYALIFLSMVLLFRRRRRVGLGCLLTLAVLLAACGDDSTAPGTDAGTSLDAMPATDAGATDAPISDAGADAAEPCEPGATRTSACGNCGLASESCNSDGLWERTSGCLDEKDCAPGTVETEALEMCAERQRICDDECAWRDWSMTADPGCSPGETRVARADCTEGGVDHYFVEQTCTDECTWERTTCHDGCQHICVESIAGEPCWEDSHCEADSYCNDDGICAPSEPCGSYCEKVAEPSHECELGMCVLRGEPLGAPCTTEDDCSGDWFCSGDGLCTTGCDGGECPRGFYCDRGFLGKCVPYPSAEE